MKTVLIADDALFMRMMLKDLLTMNNLHVVGEAEDGAEAVDKFRKLRPDLVLLDVLMPNMDGLSAAREILDQDPQARIVMLSAMGQSNFLDEARKLGVKNYITKPFSPPRVIKTINDVLSQ
jgi:two-component system chemotaxis response regulator CheY